MYTLEVEHLRKTYAQKQNFWSAPTYKEALKGVSFQVKQGEIFGLLGPNGAGKSTLIHILIGLLSADSGRISIFGKDLGKHDEAIRNRMNIATAYASLPGELTVRENLQVFATLYGLSDKKVRIRKLLERFGIEDLQNKLVRTLSAGQKARINLCKALINDPDLLLLDEPTASLDPDIATKMREILREIHQERNITILFTSHNMFEVEEMCDRIAFLRNGEIFAIDTPTNLVKLIPHQSIRVHLSQDFSEIPTVLNHHPDYHLLETHAREYVFQIPHRSGETLEFLKWLEKEKVPCVDIEIETPNLESVFMEIAQK